MRRGWIVGMMMLMSGAGCDPCPEGDEACLGGEPAAPSCPDGDDDCEARLMLCGEAANHLATCLGEFAPEVPPDCARDEAEQIIAADCETLAEAVGAPIAEPEPPSALSRAACAMGFYFACPEPACRPDPDIVPPAPGDGCRAWTRYSDCGLCEYYRCREQTARCGPDGYLLGYVGIYCDRFAQVTEPRVSPRAQAWLERVRRCLVNYLEEEVAYDAPCEEIYQRGTDSHALCYLETGFCDLSVADWFAIVHTVDPGDVPLRQVLATGHGCLRDWLGLE